MDAEWRHVFGAMQLVEHLLRVGVPLADACVACVPGVPVGA